MICINIESVRMTFTCFMPKLENIAQTYQLAMQRIVRAYAPVQRYVGNPYYPKNVRDCYGNHIVRIKGQIDEFDVGREICSQKSDDGVLAHFDPSEAKQLVLLKPAPISLGALYVLPNHIETNAEKSLFYENLKRQIAKFVFTLSVIETMVAQVGKKSPVFSGLAQDMQTKAITMSYEDYTNYLVNDFFQKYPSPIDYFKDYVERTGENDLLKLVNLDLVEAIVEEELMKRYIQLERYETPEAALVNLLDSILSEDEFIIRAPEGARQGQVQKSIRNVRSEPDGIEFVESVAKRLNLRQERIPLSCKQNGFFNGTITALKQSTLGKYKEVTGVTV